MLTDDFFCSFFLPLHIFSLFSVWNSNLFFKNYFKILFGFFFHFRVLSPFWIFCECFFPPFCVLCVCVCVCVRMRGTKSLLWYQNENRDKRRGRRDNFHAGIFFFYRINKDGKLPKMSIRLLPPIWLYISFVIPNYYRCVTCDGVSSFSNSLLPLPTRLFWMNQTIHTKHYFDYIIHLKTD